MSRRILPWDELRAGYVEGTAVDPDGDPTKRSWPSLDDVARLFGVNPTTVRKMSAKEHWADQREAFQIETERVRRQRLAEQRADQALRVDERGLDAAEAGMNLIGTRLGALIRAEPENVADRGKSLDASELAALGLAAKRMLDVKAAVMGGGAATVIESLDELERQARVEEALLAAELAAHIASRRAEEAEDESEGVQSS